VFLAGTPSADAEPVAAMLTPTLISAIAACGRAKIATSAAATKAAVRQYLNKTFITLSSLLESLRHTRIDWLPGLWCGPRCEPRLLR
jgi:hypothetical protein